MTLEEQLLADMKEAMKAREAGKTRLSVIRMARAALKNAEIARGHKLSEPEIIEVLAHEVKERQDSIPEFARGGRDDLVTKLEEEIRILKAYLPAQLSEEEIRRLARETIARVGAAGPRDLGKVMGALMPETKGRADGRLVNQIVRELLEQQ
ncbi:MAG TPA: GatB/YqeY domain-containing protein [Firmicutes bacterium]|nr:GatB/YqeY domain-containing protein [Bacillota bacterium]